jgi:hypothetical protein
MDEAQLTAARRSAAETYQRRRARSAVDMLLDTDPKLWDEHTRTAVVRTLPRLATIEPWEVRELERSWAADGFDAAMASPQPDPPRECLDPDCGGLHVGPWSHVRGRAR